MTIKIKVECSFGFVGGSHLDTLELEIEDGLTDEQIEEEKNKAAYEWATQFIDYSYEDIEN